MAGELEDVVRDTAALAAAVGEEPNAPVACYSGWTLVELAGHVGNVHRWVTGIVESGAASRPRRGLGAEPAPTDGLPGWLEEGAAALVAVLAAADPAADVWTISRHDRTMGFWRRRMALETALHRWDAEHALGRDHRPDPALAAAGVEEALDVYLAQRLDPAIVAGTGQRVAFVPPTGEGWSLALGTDAITVHEGADRADATVRGSTLDLWLLLTCRRGLEGLEVEGDVAAAELAVRAATLSPGPAG